MTALLCARQSQWSSWRRSILVCVRVWSVDCEVVERRRCSHTQSERAKVTCQFECFRTQRSVHHVVCQELLLIQQRSAISPTQLTLCGQASTPTSALASHTAHSSKAHIMNNIDLCRQLLFTTT